MTMPESIWYTVAIGEHLEKLLIWDFETEVVEAVMPPCLLVCIALTIPSQQAVDAFLAL